MTTAPPRDDYDVSSRRMTGYLVASFAGIMLLTTAVLQVLEGIAAVASDKVFVTGIDYVYEFDVTTWGWIHIVIGAIGVATAAGILTNQAWGHIMGICLAGLGVLVSFAFMPYYPLWSLVVIALDILVIWALCNQVASGTDL